MDFFDDKVWHHEVHQRLGEVLFYFVARISPFEPDLVKSRLNRLFLDRRLGSVRVFSVFGAYDLIIRAWLHPNIANRFRTWLDTELKTCRSLHVFEVTDIYKRWYLTEYPDKVLNRQFLEILNESKIRQIQDGTNTELLREAIDCRVVIPRGEHQAPTIKFYVAVNLENLAQESYPPVVKKIERFLEREAPMIKDYSLYHGFGFCSILIKGHVEPNDYFSIAVLPNWIGDEFKILGAATETYLIHSDLHMVGDERISDLTFQQIRGKNFFVQSILPELYDGKQYPDDKRHAIENLLDKHFKGQDLARSDIRMLHDYLFGFLDADATQMAKTVFIFFADLEKYLRSNFREFVGRVARENSRTVYEAAHVESQAKFVSLGQLLSVYTTCIKVSRTALGPAADSVLAKDWAGLVNLRNVLAHGDFDFSEEWQDFIIKLFAHMRHARLLLALIESVTEKPFVGTY